MTDLKKEETVVATPTTDTQKPEAGEEKKA